LALGRNGVDHLNKKQRSLLMAKIRSKNTKPEMAVRRLVWNAGFRYRLCDKTLPGSPDLVFKSRRKVIFVNGCFWHGHGCRKNGVPKTRTKFWREKIERNQRRDKRVLRLLRQEGWKCLVVWECEIKKPRLPEKVLRFLR
jgi:DNA mismatch endonuclease (patch repair protein)